MTSKRSRKAKRWGERGDSHIIFSLPLPHDQPHPTLPLFPFLVALTLRRTHAELMQAVGEEFQALIDHMKSVGWGSQDYNFNGACVSHKMRGAA